MTKEIIKICGQSFDCNSEHFGFEWPFTEINEMSELRKLSLFTQLESASFGSTNLNDLGLKYVCENTDIENLDLQDTQITNKGIEQLSQLKNLKYLRLKENPQLDNSCVQYLNKLESLINLQIHETSIDNKGIESLNLVGLSNLLVDEMDRETLLNLSKKLPKCTILVKGKAEFLNGEILWEK